MLFCCFASPVGCSDFAVFQLHYLLLITDTCQTNAVEFITYVEESSLAKMEFANGTLLFYLVCATKRLSNFVCSLWLLYGDVQTYPIPIKHLKSVRCNQRPLLCNGCDYCVLH